MVMKRIKHFEEFLFETDNDVQFIADLIQKSAGGPGTDEGTLADAIAAIPDVLTLVKVNQVLSGDSKYSYKSVGDMINGELGFLDGYYKGLIESHIKKIGAQKYITSIVPPVLPAGDIIKQIIPRVKKHEGVKPKKYIDSRGIPTVGVGFNLKRSDADQKLKSVGANPVKVKQGKQALNNNQIETLLVGDLKSSKEAANRIVGNLTQHPAGVQGVLVEMAFNLGASGLSEFKNFLSAVKAKNYTTAAKEMLKSNWSKQVGDRAKTLADIVSGSQG
jgi:lysozyme